MKNEKLPYVVMPDGITNRPRIIWTDRGAADAVFLYTEIINLPGTPIEVLNHVKEGWDETPIKFHVLRIPKNGLETGDDLFQSQTFEYT